MASASPWLAKSLPNHTSYKLIYPDIDTILFVASAVISSQSFAIDSLHTCLLATNENHIQTSNFFCKDFISYVAYFCVFATIQLSGCCFLLHFIIRSAAIDKRLYRTIVLLVSAT